MFKIMSRISKVSTANLVSAAHIAERAVAVRLVELFARSSSLDSPTVQVVNMYGDRLDLPASLADVMLRAAELMAEGLSVTVLADEEMLTTQAAANVLNVSRQYLVRLVDDGKLPAVKVGSHRRLRASDVEAFRSARDRDRQASLDRLVAFSEDVEGYALQPANGVDAA
jgi:excisionase family DNA binding protein